jgi:hypothetical protein
LGFGIGKKDSKLKVEDKGWRAEGRGQKTRLEIWNWMTEKWVEGETAAGKIENPPAMHWTLGW